MTEATRDEISFGDIVGTVRTLADEIGARPTGSLEERRAAEYVRTALAELGCGDIHEQLFRTHERPLQRTLPLLSGAAGALLIGLISGRWGKVLSGGSLLYAAYALNEVDRSRPPFFQPWMENGISQNVMTTIAAAGEQKRHLVLLAHLDTAKQSSRVPRDNPALTKPANTAVPALLGVGALALLADGLQNKRGLRPAGWLALGVAVYTLLETLTDARQPAIDGANDNASGVAVLLGVAAALREQPLDNVAVTLLFTGGAEAGGTGIETYLDAFKPASDTTLFLNVDMVGAGDLVFVNRAGISHTAEYVPGPRMTALAGQVARQHPELGLRGAQVVTVDEVAVLRDRDYDALTLAAVDAEGSLPHWYRVSDTTKHITPETLDKAARAVWAMLHTLDEKLAE